MEPEKSASLPFAVPAYAVESAARKALRRKKLRIGREKAVAGDFVIDVIRVNGRGTVGLSDAELAAFYQAVGRKEEDFEWSFCAIGDLAGVPMLLPRKGTVTFADEDRENKDQDDMVRRETACNAYRPSLMLLSRLVGAEIVFHHGGGHVRDPYADDGKTIHVFSNGGPPGDFGTEYVAVAFGVSVNQDNLAVLRRTASKGRGTVLKDKETAVAQVLGANFYFLLPMVSSFHKSSSPLIFQRTLALSWNERYRQLKEGVDAAPAATRDAFVKASEEWITSVGGGLKKTIVKNDGTIQTLQKQLADALRFRRELEAQLSSFNDAPFVKEALERAPRDFAAIRRIPEVRRVSLVENGVHVETKLIHAEYGGKRYALGRYVIRISSVGGVSVWCEETKHPRRVPHPHIHLDGNACFGNAVEAIAKNAAYHRYFDTVTLVIRWLAKGYTPILANVKIEEWPEAAVGTPAPATVAAAEPHDPDKPPDTLRSQRNPGEEAAALSRRAVDVTVKEKEGGMQ